MTSTDVQPRGCTHFKLRQLLRAVARHYDAEMSRAGLKGTQYSLLSQVASLEPVQPVELARRMGLDASTLTRNLRVLTELGWLEQGPGADARSRLIRITPTGQAKRAEAQRCWKKAQLGMNEKFGAEQVAALHALIDHGLETLADAQSETAA